ncbi:MAG: hypothetical protein R2854_21320 [Caldilineaceae bacterium]
MTDVTVAQGARQPALILLLTERSPRHQQAAIDAAPPGTTVVVLRHADRDAILARLPDVDFLISERAGVIDAAMIRAGTKLRLIQRLGTFTHDIDLEAARAAGIPVYTLPVRGCMMVAEHMLLQMLALLKRLPDASSSALVEDDWGRPSRRTDEYLRQLDRAPRRRPSLSTRRWASSASGRLVQLADGCGPCSRRRCSSQAHPVASQCGSGAGHHLRRAGGAHCGQRPFSVACCLTTTTDMSLNAAVFAALPPGALVVLRQRRHRRGCLGPRPAWRTSGRRRIGHLQWEPLLPDNPLLALARDPAMNVLLTPHTAAGTGAGRGGRAGDYVHVVRALADGHAS